MELSVGDTENNICEYLYGKDGSEGFDSLGRYSSFDYCFNYFQAFRERKNIAAIADTDQIQISCLQLGFFLASWGMLRGSAALLTKSVKVYEPLVQAIAAIDPILWNLDCHNYEPSTINMLLECKRVFSTALGFTATDILTTKIMLGVFGNVPAFDENFQSGFKERQFTRRALEKVRAFYEDHQALIERYRRGTLDFSTGQLTQRQYTRAKVIDMIFYIEGKKLNSSSQ